MNKRLRNIIALAAGEAQVTHGLASTYTNYRCRCDGCKAAWNERCCLGRERRRAAMVAGEVAVKHGLTSTYFNYSCRCADCRAANAAAARRRKQRQAAS